MRTGLAGLVIGAILAAAPAAALAAPATITNDPNNLAFLPTTFNHDAGTVATFVHQGSLPAAPAHNVTSAAAGPDGKALFQSTTTQGSAPVQGTEFLPAGSYPFVCTIHIGMRGDLVVGAGTPQPRPTVAIKVLDRKLAKVERSHRLRVRVTTSGTGAVMIRTSLGKTALTAPSQLAGPVSRVVKLPITSKGRAKLDDLSKAKVKVFGTVDYGSPVSVARKLK